MKISPLLVALISSGLLASAAAPGGSLSPGESLLANPKPAVAPTFGWWVEGRPVEASAPGAAAAKVIYQYLREEGGVAIKFVSKEQGAGASVGVHCNGKIDKVPAGTLIRAGMMAKGSLTQAKPNAKLTVGLTIITNFGRGGESVVYAPKPLVGTFDWTPVEVVFAVPVNTDELKLMSFLDNAAGEVEFKNVHVDIAPPGTALTAGFSLKAKYATPQELASAAADKEKATQERERAELHIPDPDKIYSPKPALSGPHPRFMFPGTPLAEVRARLARPEYKRYLDDVFRQADAFLVVPAKPPMNQEDPLREYGNRLPVIAMAYLASDTPQDKAKYLDGASRFIREAAAWGLPEHDLPNSQMIYGFAIAYDWLNDALPADAKKAAREHLVRMARWMRDPMNVSALQWRTSFWLANHKWYNYSALAMAAAVLWGETDGLRPGEQKVWLDEAMQTFWVVAKTLGPDGAPIEGYNYDDYGLSPYFDFATIADQLTVCPQPFLDNPGIRNKPAHRLASLLPNHAGFFTYADSMTRIWNGAKYYRYIASRFHDGVAQLLADIMENGEGAGDDISENYDQALPEHTSVLAQAKTREGAAKTAPAAVVWEAESVAALPPGYSKKIKNGSHGEAIIGDKAGALEYTVSVPQAGLYALWIKIAAGGDGSRSLQIDGKTPFREASYLPVANTGGWSTEHNDWRVMVLGEDDPKLHAPYLFYLSAGPHHVTWTNEVGGGANLDWFAFTPAGTDKAAVVAKVEPELTGVPRDSLLAHGAVHNLPATDWRGIFWYDPSVPAARLDAQPLYRDSDDLGIYTARSSWTDPRANWFGFKCGPQAGKQVAEIFGPLLGSGHVHPDEGTISFYAGSHPVLPGAQYAHEKFTTNHNVVVVESTDKKGVAHVTGQAGEGGGWFGSWKSAQSQPTVLQVVHQPTYHSYLCELGGLYAASKYPHYRRSVTFLPMGAVVVVDKLESVEPMTFHSRLLTFSKDLKVNGNTFEFTVGKVQGRIVDFTAQPVERVAQPETLPSYNNPNGEPPLRNVAIVKAVNTTKVVFAEVLGVNGAENNLRVQADDKGIVITGAPGGTITLGWLPDKQPAPITMPISAPKTAAR